MHWFLCRTTKVYQMLHQLILLWCHCPWQRRKACLDKRTQLQLKQGFTIALAVFASAFLQQHFFKLGALLSFLVTNFLATAVSWLMRLQVNTLAAEKLYSLAGDWAGLGPDTLLFDICCGTGTIGLTLANRVGMVIFPSPIWCSTILLELRSYWITKTHTISPRREVPKKLETFNTLWTVTIGVVMRTSKTSTQSKAPTKNKSTLRPLKINFVTYFDFWISHQVVGIEMNDSAVIDAKRNAEINGIRNCRFVCSKVRFGYFIVGWKSMCSCSIFRCMRSQNSLVNNPFYFLNWNCAFLLIQNINLSHQLIHGSHSSCIGCHI